MTTTTPTRRAGRPSRPPLTERQIAEAALALIDEFGWPGCTMQRLALRLGVRAPSLYHYIDGRREIIELVRALVVEEIHDPAIFALPWDEAMRRFGYVYYRAFAEHPNTIQPLSTTPIRDPATLALYEAFLSTLVRDGWDRQRAFEALLGIEHLALGFAFEWNAEDLMLDSSCAAEHGAPLLAEVTLERTDQAAIAESSFVSLLERLIETYRRELDEPAGSIAR